MLGLHGEAANKKKRAKGKRRAEDADSDIESDNEESLQNASQYIFTCKLFNFLEFVIRLVF